MNRKATSMIVLAGLVLATGCGRRAATTDRHQAVVSVEPLVGLVEAVAGEAWDVTSLSDPSADPESFDPPVSAMRRAAQSDALFVTGLLPFEQATIARISDGGATVVDLGEDVELVDGTHPGAEADPHLWASLRNAQVMARTTARQLSAIDPAGADGYVHRADSVIEVLSRADRRIDSMLRLAGSRAFLVRHPALSYFARDYLLEQVAVGADNKELSVDAVRQAVKRAGAVRAAVYLVETQSEGDRAGAIAADLGIPVVQFAPMSRDIAGELTRVATEIANAQTVEP